MPTCQGSYRFGQYHNPEALPAEKMNAIRSQSIMSLFSKNIGQEAKHRQSRQQHYDQQPDRPLDSTLKQPSQYRSPPSL
jgi:hypothetical protein